MVAYAKRNAALATTVGAILVSILLIVFFGAWAVAASSEPDFSRVLSGAAAPPAFDFDKWTGGHS